MVRGKKAWFAMFAGLSAWGCMESSAPSAPAQGRDSGNPDVTQGPGAAFPEVTIPAQQPKVAVVPADLVILSFNIRYGTANDGTNSWSFRKPLLFDVIKNQNADLIGMQEALDSQIKEIQVAVPGYTRLGVGRDDGKASGEFSPILFRTERFKVDTSGTFWLSDTPEIPGSKHWGNNITRICSWAHLTDKATNRGFYLFNAHLDHESQPSREKSAVLIIQRMQAVKHNAEPAFLTGDFNVGETDPVVRYLTGKATLAGKANPMPFADSFRMINPDVKAASTFHGFNGGTTGDKIDYVMVPPRMQIPAAEIIRTNVNGKYPSDHYPINASVVVPEWASTSIRRN
jgi:endonuclease/exonuclease/phosphatase family metal-dependent hydrolase